MKGLRELRMETRGWDFGLKGYLTGKEYRQKSNTRNNRFGINTSLAVLNFQKLQRQYYLRKGQQRDRAAGVSVLTRDARSTLFIKLGSGYLGKPGNLHLGPGSGGRFGVRQVPGIKLWPDLGL